MSKVDDTFLWISICFNENLETYRIDIVNIFEIKTK